MLVDVEAIVARAVDRERALRRVDPDRASELAVAQIERRVADGELQLNEVVLKRLEHDLRSRSATHERAWCELQLDVRLLGGVERITRCERHVHLRRRPVLGPGPPERDLAVEEADAGRRRSLAPLAFGGRGRQAESQARDDHRRREPLAEPHVGPLLPVAVPNQRTAPREVTVCTRPGATRFRTARHARWTRSRRHREVRNGGSPLGARGRDHAAENSDRRDRRRGSRHLEHGDLERHADRHGRDGGRERHSARYHRTHRHHHRRAEHRIVLPLIAFEATWEQRACRRAVGRRSPGNVDLPSRTGAAPLARGANHRRPANRIWRRLDSAAERARSPPVRPAPNELPRLPLLHDLVSSFAARLELAELVPLVVRRCREALDATAASVLLLDEDTKELYFPYVAEDDPAVAERLLRLRFPADRGVAGEVLRTGRALRVDDVSGDSRFFGGVDEQTGTVTRTLLCAPLRSRRGVIGTVEVVNRRGGGTFGDEDLDFLEVLAGGIAVAIENARRFASVKASAESLRAEVTVMRRELAHREGFPQMIGSGAAMVEVFSLMESAAASPIAVLIDGETGTGKELVARGIHSASPRAAGPFVAVNCAALPESLLESELFGHRRGAFTGATEDRRGLFEAANGGTIFLDEIGDTPPAMQAKILRVLQEREVVPVGDRRPRQVDVRVISATNRDLAADLDRGTFRSDLYYRLAAFPIHVPPLRERREDVPLLAARFLSAAAERHGKQVPGFDPVVIDALVRFDWPGNVRELVNEIERAVALARDGEMVGMRHLSAKLRRTGPGPAPAGAVAADAPGEPVPLRTARAAFEARHIANVLARHGGNVTQAARALGLSRFMLQKKLKEYRLRSARS